MYGNNHRVGAGGATAILPATGVPLMLEVYVLLGLVLVVAGLLVLRSSMVSAAVPVNTAHLSRGRFDRPSRTPR